MTDVKPDPTPAHQRPEPNQLLECLLRDQHRLRRRLRAAKNSPEQWPAIETQVAQSQQRVRERAGSIPVPKIDPGLPINQHRDEIKAALESHQVLIVCGETGSGKTTQLPQICLELGYGARGMIGHTQPRRIAARAVANRISEELNSPLGELVGYKVRFNDRLGPNTLIKLMTDGMLLAETQGERFLNSYEVLIIDEAHERSLNIDFLLGYLRQLLPKRPELKVLITSATIDPERFSRQFNNAPIIEVSGRSFPVEIRYQPLLSEDEDERDRNAQEAIVAAVDELRAAGPGDILVFLSGEREIRETAETLRKHKLPDTDVLPLYARLSAAEQNRVFKSSQRRRIVLATNVAETSLTVPGIRYVIDPGSARISRYSHRAKVQRLPIESISQASAAQRAGRCGRVAPGICIRLYAEAEFAERPAFTDPEILRTSLASVILQMAAFNLGAIESFPFIDPPDRRQISDGFRLLFELQAVTEQHKITPLGRQLARLPIDPRLGRMLLAAGKLNCVSEILIIVSALAIQDPRERPLEHQQAADQKHRRFSDKNSDFTALLNLWEHIQEQTQALSKNQLRSRCRKEFISYVRVREWIELQTQLRSLAATMGVAGNHEPADYANIHQALLTGLLGNIGLKKPDEPLWTGARGRKIYLFPGSGLFKHGPKWLMAAELTETTRLFARTCARIEPGWAERYGEHLLKRSYSAAFWQRRVGQVSAKEQVTLYGIPLVTGRRVNYGPLAPELAHDIFIRDALVGNQIDTRGKFLARNRASAKKIRQLEAKIRRRNLLVDDEVLVEFYKKIVPATIYSTAQFERWRKRAERDDPTTLLMNEQDLLYQPIPESVTREFPDTLPIGSLRLPLSYEYDPLSETDGVTVSIPLAALNQVDSNRFEWVIPGLLAERMTALIKSLPKGLRKNFVPVPDIVKRLIAVLSPSDASLCSAMAQQLEQFTGVAVAESDWQPDGLANYLLLRIQVLDPNGVVVASGRDIGSLQRKLGSEARNTFDALPTPEFDRDCVTEWDFGTLPESVEFERNGVTLTGFPGLISEAPAKAGQPPRVALRVLDSAQRALQAHQDGTRRLLNSKLREKLRFIQRNIPDFQKMSLHYISVGSQNELRNDLLAAIGNKAYFDGAPAPRDKAGFDACLQHGKDNLGSANIEIATQVAQILERYHGLRSHLSESHPITWKPALDDIDQQLRLMIYPGFIAATPPQWLEHIPRYLKAIELRIGKLSFAPDKDRQRFATIEPLWLAWLRRQKIVDRNAQRRVEVQEFRWLIEELRVSQFAQELRTIKPVSAKRLDSQWRRIID